jgi:hypothetical protein
VETAIEELRVTEEELRRQNEELAAAHSVVEERLSPQNSMAPVWACPSAGKSWRLMEALSISAAKSEKARL